MNGFDSYTFLIKIIIEGLYKGHLNEKGNNALDLGKLGHYFYCGQSIYIKMADSAFILSCLLIG